LFCFYSNIITKKHAPFNKGMDGVSLGLIAGFVYDCFSLNLLGHGMIVYAFAGAVCSKIVSHKKDIISRSVFVLFLSMTAYILFEVLSLFFYDIFLWSNLTKAFSVSIVNMVCFFVLDSLMSRELKVRS